MQYFSQKIFPNLVRPRLQSLEYTTGQGYKQNNFVVVKTTQLKGMKNSTLERISIHCESAMAGDAP